MTKRCHHCGRRESEGNPLTEKDGQGHRFCDRDCKRACLQGSDEGHRGEQKSEDRTWEGIDLDDPETEVLLKYQPDADFNKGV